MEEVIKCGCKSKENNGYFCFHKNWIKSEYAKRGYKKVRLTKVLKPKDPDLLKRVGF